MNEITSLALELQSFCEKREWRFCLIGGLVVQHWGEPRFTKDVDMTLIVGFGNEEIYINDWLSHFEARIPNAFEFAMNHRVLLLRSPLGIGIDIALGALPFEEECVSRAEKIEFEKNAFLRICTAEDLIIMKAFADRPQDWLDIRGILVRQKMKPLDFEYIWRNLTPLVELKENPHIITNLKKIIEDTK